MSNFISIIDDNTPFDYTFPGTDTTFKLRIVPESVQKSFTKRHTSKKPSRGGPIDIVDTQAVANDCLNYAIIGWKGVVNPLTHQEIECTEHYKKLLPEMIKVDVVRMCVGREAGAEIASQNPQADDQTGDQDPQGQESADGQVEGQVEGHGSKAGSVRP